jgi:membrane fusion protein (multidrug efflux system)
MTKRKIVISALVVSVLAIGWGWKKHHSLSAMPETPAVMVSASVVKEASLPVDVNAIGTLVAARKVDVTPELAGHVIHVFPADGAFVKAGAPLVQLSDATYKAQLESAKAQLVFSERKYNRMQQLVKRGFVSQQTIDELLADLKEKRASAQEIEVLVNRMQLTAPFDGVVGKFKVNPGDYVNVGQGLVTLTDTKHLRIEYNVPERYVSLLKQGQEVKITTSSYPGKIFIGKVAFISPTITADNRSIAIYADVLNEENLLKPGMFANVAQSLGNEEHALIIPARSLIPMMDGEQVYKIVDGKALPVTVMIGKRAGDNVQILQGLTSGDVVITDGQLKVQTGVPVKTKS